MKRICVDIDGTICTNTNGDYEKAKPIKERIDMVNEWYNAGAEIIYWTARGGNSGKDWRELTEYQLQDWGCKHHELVMGKMPFDYFIDDKAYNAHKFFTGGYF